MVVVPDTDEMQIEGRLPANEIDQVQMGQGRAGTLFLRSTSERRPELRGVISHVFREHFS